jgi:hypothetical protein
MDEVKCDHMEQVLVSLIIDLLNHQENKQKRVDILQWELTIPGLWRIHYLMNEANDECKSISLNSLKMWENLVFVFYSSYLEIAKSWLSIFTTNFN